MTFFPMHGGLVVVAAVGWWWRPGSGVQVVAATENLVGCGSGEPRR
jgi:hypothetical protein